MLTGLQLRSAIGLLVLAAAFGAGWRFEHVRAVKRAATVAAAQAVKDAAASAAFAKAVTERDQAQKLVTTLNRKIYAELEPQRAAAVERGNDLARRLRDAYAALASRGTVPEGAGHAGAAGAVEGAGTVQSIAGRIERANADFIAECLKTDANYTALQAEVRGQLDGQPTAAAP